jgi:hypothetical protein
MSMRFSLPLKRQNRDESCKKLDEEEAVEFHNLVEKTLYATKRARPETCTAIAFLTTIV